MATKNSKTRAFATTANKGKKSLKNRKRIRQKIVISIFAVIALILLVFAALIIGQIIGESETPNPTTPSPNKNGNVMYIPRDAGNVKIGNLLLINDDYGYSLPDDLSDMVNIYQYQRNDANKANIQLNGVYTYALTYDTVCLNTETLNAFNKFILDYCNTPGFTSSNEKSYSNLEIAWGGYTDNIRHEYQEDIANIGKDYYDHGMGTTLTLKINNPSTVIKESVLKTQFAWIYENAHKYGFILRFPDACENHTGFDSSKRIHLRFVGIEHATYIYENNICLEEYLELIRMNHNYNNPLVINSANGKTYNVYYVSFSGNPTSVPVPKDSNYSISGDNMNGFIVTVEK